MSNFLNFIILVVSSARLIPHVFILSVLHRTTYVYADINITLEDETGHINVILWKGTQETFRQTQALRISRFLLIKGF